MSITQLSAPRANKNIILEITPTYVWQEDDPLTGDDSAAYDKFMKTYKPILFRTIPRYVAEQWLKQAQGLIDRILKSQDKIATEQHEE